MSHGMLKKSYIIPLQNGIEVASLADAQATIRSYRDQITSEKERTAEVANSTQSQGAGTSQSQEANQTTQPTVGEGA